MQMKSLYFPENTTNNWPSVNWVLNSISSSYDHLKKEKNLNFLKPYFGFNQSKAAENQQSEKDLWSSNTIPALTVKINEKQLEMEEGNIFQQSRIMQKKNLFHEFN